LRSFNRIPAKSPVDDLSGLKPLMPQPSSEPLNPALNGIAYDAAGRRLFVTGKLWPKVFQIRLKPQPPGTQ
jgi:glutamine cyclotransferase